VHATRTCHGYECPLLAQSRHELVHRTCPLLGVKRTLSTLPATRFYRYDGSSSASGNNEAARVHHTSRRRGGRGNLAIRQRKIYSLIVQWASECCKRKSDDEFMCLNMERGDAGGVYADV
jgi:hypothetical protein